ncbi:MAG: hypothetical protein AABM66_01580 [Actinomycetota bacterium]
MELRALWPLIVVAWIVTAAADLIGVVSGWSPAVTGLALVGAGVVTALIGVELYLRNVRGGAQRQ